MTATFAAPRLDRTLFTVSRAAEYFRASELEAQTGQPRSRFATVALKELTDNCLDACEATGLSPDITMSAMRSGGKLRLSVADNGPGLTPEAITRILNFETRTSDKIGHRAPTRGLQGNALKTILGLPIALGGDSPVTIESQGQRHEIRARVDVAGMAVVDHVINERPTVAGTSISLEIPAAGQDLDIQRWGRAFSLLNPHLSVKIRACDEGSNVAQSVAATAIDFYQSTVAFPGGWGKWLPSDPTSPHWYDESALRTLIFHYVAAAQRSGSAAMLLRDFVRQFRGLTANAKAKAVCDQVPGIAHLSDFEDRPQAIAALLAAMQDQARPAKPNALGWIGEDHLRARIDDWYGLRPDRFWYCRVLGESVGIPFVVEAAVAETETLSR